MVEKISVQLAVEGSEDIRKQLEALGKSGAQAFKQIQDAAAKPITDPTQINQTKQAMNALVAATATLGPQFQALANSAQQFGIAGAQAGNAVAQGLNQTSAAAQQAGAAFKEAADNVGAAGAGVGTGLISAATAFKIAAVGIVAAIAAMTNALAAGTQETAKAISDQAQKLQITVGQWLELKKAIAAAGSSTEDFIKSAGQGIKKIGDAQKELLALSRVRIFNVLDAEGNEKQIKIIAGAMDTLTQKNAAAVLELRKFGVTMEALKSESPLAALKELATIIGNMPDGAQKAAAGLKFFGDQWKDTIKVLNSAGKVQLDPLKAGRELTEQQVEAAKAAANAWDDLGNAVRATKDQIGALFSDSSKARADWLTNLVDGSRELLKTWLGLSDVKGAEFLKGLGDSSAESAFKILVAVGQQLAGIWRDVLVPAGQQLMNIVKSLAGSFKDVTTSQVVAFFITAAIAASGLAVALKGIGVVLAPIAALIATAFSPFGAVLLAAAAAAALFWDQIKEGANSVLAILPQQIAQIQQALQRLFAGDFAGAWALFKEAATTALEDIGRKLQTTKGIIGDFFRAFAGGIVELPWVQTLVNGLKQIGADFPATIELIMQGLIGLGNAATGAANAINFLFGTKLTGTDIGAVLVIAQLTGGLQALASVAVITSAAMTVLFGAIGLLITAIGGLPAAAVLVGTALIGLALYLDPGIWNFYASAAMRAFALITPAVKLVSDAISVLTGNVGGSGASAWGIFRDAALSSLNPIIGALNALLNLIELVKRGLASAQALRAPGAPLPQPGGVPMARGGLLGGRGTGTSDSNLAWVSRGEHIMPARAVAQPGVLAFLEALRRSGGNLSRVLDGMGRFALGGMVPRVMPAFAAGGLAGGSNVTIQFPGLPAISGLRASSDVVDQLHKAAALAQVRSGGRKPSRYS